MFHTPPIKPSFTDESTTESYSDPLRARSYTLQSEPTSIDIDEDELPQELPPQLDELIDNFLKDLRAPKYSKPLTPEQLSSTFQNFYHNFHSKTETFVKGSVYYKRRVSKIELLTADEIDEQKRFTRRIDFKIRRYIEIAEEKLCVELFDRLFNKFPKDIKINTYLNDKIRIIQKIKGIKYDVLLDIPNIDLDHSIVSTISAQFKEMTHFKTPYSKLKVLMKVHSSINQFIKTQISSDFVDGDYFLPLLIYVMMIDTNDVDFYSNFTYVKRFRQQLLLVEEPLYCLTNFEAAITFIQHLELADDEFDYSELSQDEFAFLTTKPLLENDESIDIVIPSDRHILSNSTDGIKMISSAIDVSFKSMIHRFGSSHSTAQVSTTTGSNVLAEAHVSAPNEETTATSEGYNPLNKIVGVMKWRSNTSTPQPAQLAQQQPQPTTKSIETEVNGLKLNDEIPIDIHKFQNKNFKDMSISELEDMFNDFNTVSKWLDIKNMK